MDFNDSPVEAEFRAQVRTWLDANARPRQGKRSLNRRVDSERGLAIAKEWQAKKADAGYAVMHFPKEYGGQGRPILYNVIFEEEESKYDVPVGLLRHRVGHVRPGDDDVLDRGAEAPLPAQADPRRGGVVPALLRAGRGLRPRRPAHARGSRRRRVGGQRPEDLDFGRPLLRLRHPGHAPRRDPAQAQGPHLLLHRHEEPRHRDPSDQAGDRRLRLQRGVLHQRAHPRSPAPGRRGRRLAGLDHYADERAHRRRRQPHARRRRPAALRAQARGRERAGAARSRGARPPRRLVRRVRRAALDRGAHPHRALEGRRPRGPKPRSSRW